MRLAVDEALPVHENPGGCGIRSVAFPMLLAENRTMVLIVQATRWRTFLLLIVSLVCLQACSRISPTSNVVDPSATSLVVEPKTLDLGSVSLGTPRISKVTVRNSGRAPVSVRWHSSCECVTIEPALVEVPQGDSRMLVVRVDLHEESNGAFAVIVKGHVASSEVSRFTVAFAAGSVASDCPR